LVAAENENQLFDELLPYNFCSMLYNV